jgi:hypothetical protein
MFQNFIEYMEILPLLVNFMMKIHMIYDKHLTEKQEGLWKMKIKKQEMLLEVNKMK